jgi:hypothetical protein
MKRKLHYNEGLNIKLARQLISKDLHDDEEDEEMLESADGESMNIEESNQGQMFKKKSLRLVILCAYDNEHYFALNL